MKKTLVSTLAIALIASGCQYIDQITGAPKKLNAAEAAVRYLDIACPSNQFVKSFNERDVALGNELDNQKITLKEYGKKLDALLAEKADQDQKDSEARTSPDYVWPEAVKSLVAEMAGVELESAAAIREFLKSGGYAEAAAEQREKPESPYSKANELASEKASAIRSILRLPPRDEGCKDGKAALTVDQMKQRQES